MKSRQRVPRATAFSAADLRSWITGKTRVVGIFGDPVEHSLSPAMHNAAFAHLGWNWVYVPFHVRSSELAAATRGIRALGLVGVNVTVPHKEAIVSLLDECSPLARTIGAVNTVIHRDGRLIGDNTDVVGILRALRAANIRLKGKKAIVIGAGGAARAVVAALEEAGVGEVAIVNRTRTRAQALMRRFRSASVRFSAHDPRVLSDPHLLSATAVVINATALGLHGEPFFTVRADATPASCLFFDLIYGRETDFLRQARSAGRRTLDGLSMLLFQGARAFELWTHRRAPLAVMRAALAQAVP